MKKYKVYCLRDRQKNIKYVGQTRQSLQKRYNAHKTAKRFPTDEFTIELVADFDEASEMYKLEAMLIEQYNLVNKGWNKEYGKVKVPKETSQAGENNQFYKHSHRPEVREAIGKRSIGNKYAVGSKSRKGLKNSEYHNQRISECSSKPTLCVELNKIFKSVTQAAKELNLQVSKIAAVCRGKRKSTGGYTFRYVEKQQGGN